MGCCTSTANKPPPQPASTPPAKTKHSSKLPPPSHPLILEEESVKEVLSETPSRTNPSQSPSSLPNRSNAAKPSFPKQNAFNCPPYNSSIFKNMHELVQKQKESSTYYGKPRLVFAPEEETELSEICSSTQSETVSVSLTDKSRENEHDYCGYDQPRQRSPAKFRHRQCITGEVASRRDMVAGKKSPARRAEQSPGRVGFGSGSAKGTSNNNGESSGRRSRSPAMCRDISGVSKTGLTRVGSGRKTGKSPARVRSELSENTRKLGGYREEEKWAPLPTAGAAAGGGTNESLENPLVSLECFIFL